MGNLEKAGVLVVVALLAVILVVAFLNFPEQNAKVPVLGASIGKVAQAPEMKSKPFGENVYPEPEPSTDVIRPKIDTDRSSNDTPPRLDPPPAPPVVSAPPVVAPKPEETATPPVTKDSKAEHAKSASGYPKMVKVQQGESLWAIAVREYGAKAGPRMLGLIADANPKVRPEALKAGTELSLPAPTPECTDAKETTKVDKKPTPPSSGPGSKATPPAPKTAPRKLPFIPAGN
jgi:nucleoid-associated protein YgaU